MYKLHIKGVHEVNAPLNIAKETLNDWPHFTYIHKTTTIQYDLLYKRGDREIFFYKARVIPYLPFFKTSLIFRNNKPDQYGYQNVYVDLQNGMNSYINAKIVPNAKTNLMIVDYLFNLPSYWRLFPWLFLWIFKVRMRKIISADNSWMADRLSLKNFIDSDECAPKVPETYDLFDALYKDNIFADNDISFEDHTAKSFDNKNV